MADEDIRMLLEAILDYFLWLEEEPTARRVSERYRQILIDFAIFSMHNDIAWRDMFSFETFREFRNYTRLKKVLPGFQWVAGDGRLVFRKEASHARYRSVPSSVGA